MYGQSNYYYQQPQMRNMDFLPTQYQINILKGRPVSSIEEVRAAQIDFDGSLFIFPDIANKCIYTKQISANGSAILNKYTLHEEAQPALPTYVTKEEFDVIISQLKTSIENKDMLINQLQSQVQQYTTQAQSTATPQVDIPNF